MKKVNFILMLIIILVVVSACSSQTERQAEKTSGSSSTKTVTSKPSENKNTNVDIAAGVPPWQGRDNEQVQVNAAFAKGMTGIANQFAISKGWYADAGIELNLIDSSNAVAAFGAKEIDIADGDPSTFVPAIVNGVQVKVVSNLWRSRGAYWIIAKPEIKSLSDLKGKVIGSASASGGMPLTLMEVLNKNGIDPKKDVELVPNGIFQPAYATFLSGEVDATIIHNPFATMAEQDKKGNVLAKTWDYISDYQTGVMVASDKLIDEQPETLERMLEVYFYANEYAKTHLDEFLPWASEYLGLDEATVKKSIEAEIELWENDPVVDVNRLQVTEDLLAKYGMQRESISVEGTVNNQFAEQVAQTLSLGKYKKDK